MIADEDKDELTSEDFVQSNFIKYGHRLGEES